MIMMLYVHTLLLQKAVAQIAKTIDIQTDNKDKKLPDKVIRPATKNENKVNFLREHACEFINFIGITTKGQLLQTIATDYCL
jgi:hypothetical protein